MSKWTKWAVVPGYIMTAGDDGRVTMNARIAARTDAGDDIGESHFARLLLEQANAAPEMYEALKALVESPNTFPSHDKERAEELLARINGDEK